MFGKNEIVGRRYFSEQSPTQLTVTSVFMTLQGEGPFAGRPAVFVRLAKCNLACSFCDTYFDTGEVMTIDGLMWHIEGILKKYYDKRSAKRLCGLVFTGGEPVLQGASVEAFLARHADNFAFTQIESNGILSWSDLLPSTVLVISPKALEDRGKASHYIRPTIVNLARADCLKFVISARPESVYHTVPEWAFAWRDKLVRDGFRPALYVSPMNVYRRHDQEPGLFDDAPQPTLEQRVRAERVSFWTPDLLDLEEVRANHEYAAEYAIKTGAWLSMQQHLFASIP